MRLEISSSVDDEGRQRAAQRLTAGQLCSSWQHHYVTPWRHRRYIIANCGSAYCHSYSLVRAVVKVRSTSRSLSFPCRLLHRGAKPSPPYRDHHSFTIVNSSRVQISPACLSNFCQETCRRVGSPIQLIINEWSTLTNFISFCYSPHERILEARPGRGCKLISHYGWALLRLYSTLLYCTSHQSDCDFRYLTFYSVYSRNMEK